MARTVTIMTLATTPLHAPLFDEARKIGQGMGVASTSESRTTRKGIAWSVVTFHDADRSLQLALCDLIRRPGTPAEASVGDPIAWWR